MNKPKIVFFGSGPVAAASLKLLKSSFDIEAVITKPATQAEMASIVPFDVLSASNSQELDELFAKTTFTSQVAILIDFGIIVSQKVINSFPKGIINSHFSLLPEWRGADPITFAVLSGQARSGVSLMLVVEKMDEGPLLAQAPYDIPDKVTTPSLTADLVELSHKILVEILPAYLSGEIEAAPQESVSMAPGPEPTYSRKLTKDDGKIDWTKPAVQIEREIRAFIDWPKSFARLGDIDVVITKADAVASESPKAKPGEILVEDGGSLVVATGKGLLRVERLKPAGKAEMDTASFLNGYKDRLTS